MQIFKTVFCSKLHLIKNPENSQITNLYVICLSFQGEVESISLMKPKAQSEHDTGMLEFLEDIIGTTRFKLPIEHLAKKVEEDNEMRVEKLNTMKLDEITARRKEKEGEIQNMEKTFEQVQAEIDTIKKRAKEFLDLLETLCDEMGSTSVRGENLIEQIELEKAERKKLENQLEENTKSHKERVKLKEKLENKVQEEENKYEAAMATLREDTQTLQQDQVLDALKKEQKNKQIRGIIGRLGDFVAFEIAGHDIRLDCPGDTIMVEDMDSGHSASSSSSGITSAEPTSLPWII